MIHLFLSLSFLSLSYTFSPCLVGFLVSQLLHLASRVSVWLLGLLSVVPLCCILIKVERDTEEEILDTSDGAVPMCSFVFGGKRCIFICIKVQNCGRQSEPKDSFKEQNDNLDLVIWDLFQHQFYLIPKGKSRSSWRSEPIRQSIVYFS